MVSEASILTIYWYSVVLIFGGIIGSFLNVVIARLPEGLSVVSPRSRCPSCEKQIAWYDNLPVLSWLILRGKCRSCSQPISIQYPVVELLTAVLSALVFNRFVADPAHLSVQGLANYALYFPFVAALVAVTFIDLELRIIPNEITFSGVPIGFAGVVVLDMMGLGWVSWQSAGLGILLGGGVLLAVRQIYWMVRGAEGMGLGDVKLMAMLGAFLGAHPALLFVLFVSSFLGSIVGLGSMMLKGDNMKHAIPFGPFLAGAAVIYLLWGYRFAPYFMGSYR